MIKVGIRQFVRNYKNYLGALQKGEEITLFDRHKPVADICAHDENIRKPGWKRPVERVTLKSKLSLSKATIQARRENR